MYELVTPAKAGVQVGGCSPILDTGFRRYDGDFLLHRARAIVVHHNTSTNPRTSPCNELIASLNGR
jgi:hypothetical protein